MQFILKLLAITFNQLRERIALDLLFVYVGILTFSRDVQNKTDKSDFVSVAVLFDLKLVLQNKLNKEQFRRNQNINNFK